MSAAPAEWTNLERITFLLDRWDWIFDPEPETTQEIGFISSSTGMSQPPGRFPEMAFHPTVRELERCLALLALNDPPAYRHLKAFRCGAEWRQTKERVRVRLPSGKWDWSTPWVMNRIVPKWVVIRAVRRGEEFISRVFRGPISIPQELWDGLVKP